MEIEIFARFTSEEKDVVRNALKHVNFIEWERPIAISFCSKEFNSYPVLIQVDELLVKLRSLDTKNVGGRLGEDLEKKLDDIKDAVDKAREVLIIAIREMEEMKSVQDPYIPPK